MKKVFKQAATISLSLMMAFTMAANQILAEEVPVEDTTQVQEEVVEQTEETVDPNQETEEPQEETQEPTPEVTEPQVEQTTTVEDWYFDGDTFIKNENGGWEINPSVSEEEPLTKEALLEVLPSYVILVINGQQTYIPINWNIDEFGDSQYEGSFTLKAIIADDVELPEGFSRELEAMVVFDEPEETAIDQTILDNNKVPTVSPYGTTINLFDYWTNSQVTSGGDRWENANLAKDAGINNGKLLKFTTGYDNAPDYNKWHRNNPTAPVTDIVEKQLVGGYPVLNQNLSGATNLDQTARSLSYLFNSSSGTGKKAYTDVKGLLQTDDEGYFYYDSRQNYAEFDESSNSFNVYKQTAVSWKENNQTVWGQFFPFNKADDVFTEKDGTLSSKQIDADNSVLNHYFGTTMSTRFIQQYDGMTKETGGKEVEYTFSGDDDVWVFIDDVLVADLGGIHNRASLNINFRSGEIKINGSTNGTIKSKFEEAGKTGVEFNKNTFANNTYHTLNFFYLERGNSASNMSLKFNLVTVPESDIQKIDQLGNSIPGAEFTLYASDSTYKVKGQKLASGTTQQDGTFVLVDEKGYVVSLNDLYNKKIRNVILEETRVPAGYRKSGEDMHLKIATAQDTTETSDVNSGAFFVSENIYESGAFATAKVRTTLTDTISQFGSPDNTFDYKNKGTVFAVVMKYVGTDGKTENAENWRPVTGDEVSGWNVSDGYDMVSILAAAKAQPYIFELSSQGNYQVDIDGLPGDIRNYYYIQGTDTSNVKFSVGYFYTESDNLQDAESAVRLEETDFPREFAARLYVPNIGNYLLVQKTDAEGNVIDGTNSAEFAIYSSDSVENGELTENATPLATKSTRDMSKTNGDFLTLNGVAGFPNVTVDANGTVSMDFNLTPGTYYIKETKAPEGYIASDDLIKVVVTNDGVFADAGTADDDISVMVGVGSVVKSLYQQTNGTADSTLRDIEVTLQKTSSVTENPVSWEDVNRDGASIKSHLSFNTNAEILEYDQVKVKGDNKYPNDFVVNEGFARLSIKQWRENNFDGLDLKDTELAHLFSGTEIIRVANKSNQAELTISKKVVNIENTSELSVNREFTFTINLTNSDGTPVQGDINYILTSYNDVSTSIASADVSVDNKTKTLTFDENGNATLTLIRNQSATLQDIPIGANYTITEGEYQNYNSYYSVDGSNLTAGRSLTGQINLDDNDQTLEDLVEFTNVYNLVVTKVNSDNEPLSGAQFKLYRLTCTDDSHDHDKKLVEDNPNCWQADNQVYESNNLGNLVFNQLLPDNEYRLVEVKAPGGYVLSNGEWRLTYDSSTNSYVFTEGCGVKNPPAIKIDRSNGVTTYSLYNFQEGELPLTGSQGIIFYLSCGIVLMSLGGIIMILRYKRRVV